MSEIIGSAEEAVALAHKCIEAQKAYHSSDKPIEPDSTYDADMRALRAFEALHGSIGVAYDTVGAPVPKGYAKVKHLRPMLSLETHVDISIEPIKIFVARVQKAVANYRNFDGEIAFTLEHKYDGLALAPRYKGGKLELIATRGDGIEGEDVSRLKGAIPSIPLTIGYGSELEVRGELMLPKDSFEKVNAMRVAAGKEPYDNCRNAAAGMVRSQKADPEALKLLHFMSYDCFSDTQTWQSQYLKLKFLAEQGFLNRTTRIVLDPFTDLEDSAIAQFYVTCEEERALLTYDIDGVVYKVDDVKLQERMGFTNGSPNWAIAHKFAPEFAYTKLLGINIQVGRTGRITPVAVLEPVQCGGVEVKSGTLHNEDHIKEKDFRVGDTVAVHRAGDVVPEVKGVAEFTLGNRSELAAFVFPTRCPVCNKPLLRLPGEMLHYCTGGAACSAQRSLRLVNAASRTVLNIDGLGESHVQALVEKGFLKEVGDFWYLEEHHFETAGISTLVGKKIIANIETRRKTDMWRVIAALGIRLIAQSTAQELSRHIERIEQLLELKEDVLLEMADFGPGTTRSLLAYTQSEQGIEEVTNLGLLQLQLAQTPKRAEGLPKAVVTGSWAGLERNEVKEIVAEVMQYRVVGALSPSVQALIVGENPSKAKIDLAKKLDINIITDVTFSRF